METIGQPGSIATNVLSSETLNDAFHIALACDHRVEAGRWNVSAAERSWAAARAEFMPSLTCGTDYYVLSDEPALQFRLGLPPTVLEEPIANRSSAGYQCVVTQWLYTSGRLSSAVDAASFSFRAREADLSRTVLDVKMNAPESFVAVLRATRQVGRPAVLRRCARRARA